MITLKLQGPNYRQKTASQLFKKNFAFKFVGSGRPFFPIRKCARFYIKSLSMKANLQYCFNLVK